MTSLSATYYVSQRTGSDENDGRTCSTAFASLSAVNRRHLQPGDRVLLERGSVFYGQYLHVTDSGTKEAPIVIGAVRHSRCTAADRCLRTGDLVSGLWDPAGCTYACVSRLCIFRSAFVRCGAYCGRGSGDHE